MSTDRNASAVAVTPAVNPAENERIALLLRAQQGDYRAREQLVADNLRLVQSIVQRFSHCGRERDDLVQVGCIGLLKAIDRFDLSYGVCFSTYAVPLIMGEIRRLLRDDEAVSVGRLLRERAARLEKRRRELYQQWGAEPELWQLAEACDLSVEQTVEALEAARPPLSISETQHPTAGRSQRELTRGELLSDERAEFEDSLTGRVALFSSMEELPPRLSAVVRGRYFAGLTQQELGRQLGVSQVQISRLEKQALAELRRRLDGA